MNTIKSINVLAVGVGGQGIISFANVLAEAAFQAGYDVKKSEIHGLSQRGGSVNSHVCWGAKIDTPVIMDGEADYIVALEELEALRNAFMVKVNGRIIVNDFRILPITVVNGQTPYPSDMDERLAEYGQVERVRANAIAAELGEPRAANTVLLGVLARHLNLPMDAWHQALRRRLPVKALDLNLKAFERGRTLCQDGGSHSVGGVGLDAKSLPDDNAGSHAH